MTTAAIISSGCTSTQPQAAAKPVSAMVLTVKKPILSPDSANEPDIDYGIDCVTPSGISKNLPLSGTKWEWEGNLSPEHYDGPDIPSIYSLEFKPNGWFEFQADCRRGAGIYEAMGQHIALAVVKASHSPCPPGSRAEDFLKTLEAARFFSLAENKLYFEAKREIKTMVFLRK